MVCTQIHTRNRNSTLRLPHNLLKEKKIYLINEGKKSKRHYPREFGIFIVVIGKIKSTSITAKLLPWRFPASGAGLNSRLNILELGVRTRNRDSALMLKSVLLLRFSQKLSKQRMIKVNHRHKNTVKLTVVLTDVYGQVTFRNRRGFLLRIAI